VLIVYLSAVLSECILSLKIVVSSRSVKKFCWKINLVMRHGHVWYVLSRVWYIEKFVVLIIWTHLCRAKPFLLQISLNRL
jgi:ribosomal protein L36